VLVAVMNLGVSSACAQLLESESVTPSSIHQQANELFQQGITRINQGFFDEGLQIIRQTTQMEPHQPEWHMHYGSLLFTRAGLLYQLHRENEAVYFAGEARQELQRAIDLYAGKEFNVQKAQCYFLLGELAYFISKDRETARTYYQQCLELSPDHTAALDALKNLHHAGNVE